MGKASISIAVSGSYNGSALERAQKGLDNLAKKAASAGDSVSKSMMESGSRAAELGGQLYSLGDSIDRAGQGLTAGLTVPLAAAGAGALAAAADFDSAGSKIDAACGDASQSAEALKNAGRDLYRDGWGESMTQLSDSLVRAREILGDLSETDMSYAVEGAMTLEKTFGSDFAESLRGVNVLMDKFGLSATEATDLMVTGTQRGLDYTKELGDNLSEYAGRWGDAGMTASQYFSLLEAGVQNGAYSLDKVGDFLNEFLTSLSDGRMEESIGKFSQGTQGVFESFKDGGATAEDVLNAVVGELGSMTDEYGKAQIASELWSSLGEDNAMSMITALAGVNDTFSDVSGAAQQAGDEISDSLESRATSALRTAQDALVPFASTAVDMLGSAADAAKGAADGFAGLDEGTQGLIVGAGLLAAASGPVVSAGGKVVKAAGNVTTAYGRARQDVAVYADALTTTNAASLKAYQGNEKLAKALERNPAAKAAGGVQRYIDAVTDASRKTADYDSAVRRLEREQQKGSKANQELVANIRNEVAERKNAMDAANGTVEGYKATAAAAKTSTTAVTAQAAAMKAASAAGKALRAVAATIVPVAAITALVSLAGAIKDAADDARNLETATGGLSDAIAGSTGGVEASSSAISAMGDAAGGTARSVDDLIAKQAEWVGTLNQRNADTQASVAELERYRDTISELAGRADLGKDEVANLQLAVEGLNESCGTSYTVAQDSGGAYQVMGDGAAVAKEKIDELIESQEAQIQLDATKESYAEAYQKQADAAATLAEQQAKLNQAQSDYNAAKEAGLPIDQSVLSSLAAAEDGVSKAQKAYDSATDAVNSFSEQQTVMQMAIGENADSYAQLITGNQSLMAALEQSGQSLTLFRDQLSQTGVSTEALAYLSQDQLMQLGLNYDGTMGSITERLMQFSTDSEFLGTEAGQNFANSLGAQKELALQKASEVTGLTVGELEASAEAAGYCGDAAVAAYAMGVSGGSVDAYNAGKSVADNAESGASTADGYGLGYDFGDGYASGIRGAISRVVSAAGDMAVSAWSEVKAVQRSASPSKVTRGLGNDFGDGYAIGMEDRYGEAERAAAGMAERSASALSAAEPAASLAYAQAPAYVQAPAHAAQAPSSEPSDGRSETLALLLEELRAFRREIGPVIAQYAPAFPSERDMRRMVNEYVAR